MKALKGLVFFRSHRIGGFALLFYLIIIISMELLFEQMAYLIALKNHIRFRIRNQTMRFKPTTIEYFIHFVLSFFFFFRQRVDLQSEMNANYYISQSDKTL